MLGCLAPLFLGFAAFGYLAWSFGAFQQPPQIARGLRGDQGWREFEARTRQAFPIGSAASELQGALTKQGFEHEWTYADRASPRELVEAMTWRRRGCTYYEVAWRADAAGRIIWVQGSIPNMCY